MISAAVIRRVTGQYDLEEIQRLHIERLAISRISSLEPCLNLLELSLSYNEISVIEGLNTLTSLRRLDLSHNSIRRLENLSHCISLEWLDLRQNSIASVDDTSSLSSVQTLRSLYLRGPEGEEANPACQHPAYSSIVLRNLPNLTVLDGGHVGVLEATEDLTKHLDEIEPTSDALVTPPSEPWFTASDLHVDEDEDGAGEDSVRVFSTVQQTLQQVNELLSEDGSHLLRKAQAALSKANKSQLE